MDFFSIIRHGRDVYEKSCQRQTGCLMSTIWTPIGLLLILFISKWRQTEYAHTNTGLALGGWDFKSHFCEYWKLCHNWPKEQHKMGLDMSNVSSPLYPFPSPFLLGDLVNANPAIWGEVRKLRGTIVNIILRLWVLFFRREIYFTVASFIFTTASFILLPRDLFYCREFYFHCHKFCFTAASFIFSAVSFILLPWDLTWK